MPYLWGEETCGGWVMKVVGVVVVIVVMLGLNAYAYVSLAKATEVIVKTDIPYVYRVDLLEDFCRYEFNNKGAE